MGQQDSQAQLVLLEDQVLLVNLELLETRDPLAQQVSRELQEILGLPDNRDPLVLKAQLELLDLLVL